MKNLIYFLIIILFLNQSCRQEQVKKGKLFKADNFSSLSSHFMDPPVEYSTSPLWVWNDQVTHDKIEEQLTSFSENGIKQVFVHPRPGLITVYLSDEWFELWKYAMNKARELNMKIWIYDENSFPSGFAGGHVPAMLPPSADQVVGLKMHKYSRLPANQLDNFLIILKKVGNSFANISNAPKNYLDVPGEYYCFSKWYYPQGQGLYGGFSYVDLLAYGITERFNRITMKGYEDAVGDEFGKLVPGIFTDEPNIHASDDPAVIKFTPVLFRLFTEKYGYQLSNYLPCLFEKTGDWKNVRHDYYALLLDMFINRWAKPWYAYADSNSLKWTGHYWEHVWPNPGFGPDAMAMYAWHQYPGIDMLFNNEKNRPDQFGNTQAVRELNSVANQLGKERTLSETYGAGGWDLSFEDMKRLGDWEYALGVNFMCQHLSYMTLKGARKRDFPQSFSYHTPWWPHYRPLARYFHRLSWALASGEQHNRILVMEPTTTAWMYYSPDEGGDYPGSKGSTVTFRETFHAFLDTLEKYQVEYDLGCEDIIKDHGRIENGEFIVGNRAYDLVVLPPLFENMEKVTYSLMKTYLDQNGKVISFAGIPTCLEGNRSASLQKTLTDYKSNWIPVKTLDEQVISEYLASPDFIPAGPEKWNGRIFHNRRSFTDGQLVFVNNFDTLQTSEISFICPGSSAVEMDPFTGEIRTFPSEETDGTVKVQLSLEPSESRLLFFPDHSLRDIQPADNKPAGPPVPVNAPETRIVRNEPNTIALEYCDLTVDGRTFRDIYFYNAADTVFKAYLKDIYGFNYNPWSVAVQYRTNILDKNTFGPETGFEATFPFYMSEGINDSTIKAVFERPDLFSIRINGSDIKPTEGAWWLDKSFGVADIGNYLRPGRNELKVRVSPMNVLAELEPVYLTGNFGVMSTENGWLLTAPAEPGWGSWRQQGLPFYSHTVSYIKSFNNTGAEASYSIRLGSWNGTLAEVLVNDREAGIIGWKPYEMDITDQVKAGENKIEVKVYGSLKNLLGPHHNHPVSGVVTPWSFFYAPFHQPPGGEYDLDDYGLFEDYQILETR